MSADTEPGGPAAWDAFFRLQDAQFKPDLARFVQIPHRRNELVSRLHHQKATCFGESPLDNVRQLRLIRCKKCQRLVKHVAYAHHMKRRHSAEGNFVGSGDESQAFLLSPCHNRPSSSLSYVSEQKNELLLVLKRTKVDSESSGKSSGPALRSRTTSPLKPETSHLTKLASLIDTHIPDLRSFAKGRKRTRPRMLHPKSPAVASPDSDCVALRTRRHLKIMETSTSSASEAEVKEEPCSSVEPEERKPETVSEAPHTPNSFVWCAVDAPAARPVKREQFSPLAVAEQDVVEPGSLQKRPTTHNPPFDVAYERRPSVRKVTLCQIRPDTRHSSSHSTPQPSRATSEGSSHSDGPPLSPDMPRLEREDVRGMDFEEVSDPGPSFSARPAVPVVYHIRERADGFAQAPKQRFVPPKAQPAQHAVVLGVGGQLNLCPPAPFLQQDPTAVDNPHAVHPHPYQAMVDAYKNAAQASRRVKNVRLVPVQQIPRPKPPPSAKVEPSRKYYLKPMGNAANFFKTYQQPQLKPPQLLPQGQHVFRFMSPAGGAAPGLSRPAPAKPSRVHAPAPSYQRVGGQHLGPPSSDFIASLLCQPDMPTYEPKPVRGGARRDLRPQEQEVVTLSDDSDSGIVVKTPLTDSAVSPPSDIDDALPSVEGGADVFYRFDQPHFSPLSAALGQPRPAQPHRR